MRDLLAKGVTISSFFLGIFIADHRSAPGKLGFVLSFLAMALFLTLDSFFK